MTPEEHAGKSPAHPTGQHCTAPQTMPQHPCTPHTPRVTHRPRRFIPRPQNTPHPHAAGPHVCAIAVRASVSLLRVAPPSLTLPGVSPCCLPAVPPCCLSLPRSPSSHRPALLRGGSRVPAGIVCLPLSLHCVSVPLLRSAGAAITRCLLSAVCVLVFVCACVCMVLSQVSVCICVFVWDCQGWRVCVSISSPRYISRCYGRADC